ncbi:hypothetical protein GALMADRAFT_215248 [Galerina marginata CBS 339.88]|uniref:Uncharacterized protein n=1 Tax=Galerina marginata (strain CBS 339.88) TaxID=685588 RepID=A0A067SEA3_GALM3|nr:hypothetical protein GALMADRAFT_215248 [Galerina marginata CBS 339.88]
MMSLDPLNSRFQVLHSTWSNQNSKPKCGKTRPRKNNLQRLEGEVVVVNAHDPRHGYAERNEGFEDRGRTRRKQLLEFVFKIFKRSPWSRKTARTTLGPYPLIALKRPRERSSSFPPNKSAETQQVRGGTRTYVKLLYVAKLEAGTAVTAAETREITAKRFISISQEKANLDPRKESDSGNYAFQRAGWEDPPPQAVAWDCPSVSGGPLVKVA